MNCVASTSKWSTLLSDLEQYKDSSYGKVKSRKKLISFPDDVVGVLFEDNTREQMLETSMEQTGST